MESFLNPNGGSDFKQLGNSGFAFFELNSRMIELKSPKFLIYLEVLKDLNLDLIGWNVETRRCRNFNCCPGPMLDVRSWTWRFWFVSFLVWEKWGVGKRMHASPIDWEIFLGWEVEHWWTCTFFRVKKCFSQIFCEDYWQESRNHELWMIRISVFISNGCMAITSETYLSKGLAMQSGVSRYESIWIYMVHYAFITTWKSFCTIYDIWSTCSSLNWSIFGRSWAQNHRTCSSRYFFLLQKNSHLSFSKIRSM